MRRLLRHLSDDRNMMQLKRKSAIVIGFEMLTPSVYIATTCTISIGYVSASPLPEARSRSA